MDLERDPPNFFSGPYIDRRSEAREAAEWLDQARADPRTRYVLAAGSAQLVHPGDEPRVAFLSNADPLVSRAGGDELILLGWFDGAACVLLQLGTGNASGTGDAPDTPNAADTGNAFDLPPGTRFEELRPLSARLPAAEAGLLAYARAMSIWRLRHRYCGLCGSPTLPERAGHVLTCTNRECAHQFFPRIDPAIIVLVTDGERALLGRQASWPPGRYSTIAGFVEPGESLEDAVAREVLEETGVRVHQVDYHSSQPWPFPSSLMVGFHALAAPDARIRIGGELEDARWFTREQIAADAAVLPPPHAISYRLIAAWLERGPAGALARTGQPLSA